MCSLTPYYIYWLQLNWEVRSERIHGKNDTILFFDSSLATRKTHILENLIILNFDPEDVEKSLFVKGDVI